MNSLPDSSEAKFQINFKLFMSLAFAFSAYWIWPSNPKWWGFGLISIVFVLVAISLLIEALGLMMKLYARDKALREYMAQGNKPKSSKLASSDTLKKAGVIDE